MPSHPKPGPKAKGPRAMKLKPKSVKEMASARAPKKLAERKAAAKAAPTPPETGSKTDLITHMLHRPGGATSKELEQATGWQPHSVRGLLGMMRKRGIDVVSTKHAGEPTAYSIAPSGADTIGDVV